MRCRLGLHRWRSRVARLDPQFIEDGLRLGLPVSMPMMRYCRSCGIEARAVTARAKGTPMLHFRCTIKSEDVAAAVRKIDRTRWGWNW